MRRPVCYERAEEPEKCEGSGTLARVKRFLNLSLGGSGSGGGKSSSSSSDPCGVTSSRQIVNDLRTQAEDVLGQPLDELRRTGAYDQIHGVPAFVQSLCSYMLSHGADCDTLVSANMIGRSIRASLLEKEELSSLKEPIIASALLKLFLQELPEPLLDQNMIGKLSKLTKELNSSSELTDDETLNKVGRFLARKVSSNNFNLLQYLTNFLRQFQIDNWNTCPTANLGCVLACALVDAEGETRKANSRKSYSRKPNSNELLVSEMILLNHAVIFREVVTDYSSDSLSSHCDSPKEEEDNYEERGQREEELKNEEVFGGPPENEGEPIEECGPKGPPADDLEDDSTTTTTTTDSDEFRSPPVSPLGSPFLRLNSPPLPDSIYVTRNRFVSILPKLKSKPFLPFDHFSPATPDPRASRAGSSSGVTSSPAGGSSKKGIGGLRIRKRKGHAADQGLGGHDPKAFRSTAEIPDADNYHEKFLPCGKEYLPSITGFVTSPGESWTDEKLRRDVNTYESQSGAQSSESSCCISGGDLSEENEGDRDADGSEPLDEGPLSSSHEERRFFERFYPRSSGSSSGRRPKRKTKRKHSSSSKEVKSRLQSSEDEDRGLKNLSGGFASLISREDEEHPPTAFNPLPLEQEGIRAPLRDLVESSDPVQSDRSSWCLRRNEESLADNNRRFSRDDYDKSVDQSEPSSSWYDSDKNIYPCSGTKFADQPSIGLSDDYSKHSRGIGASCQAVIKAASKHVSSLKRKVKKFEEEFEMNFGYRPSHSEKMKYPHVKKYLTELSKSKKELKQMKDEMPEKKKSKSFPISLLRCQESTATAVFSSESTTTMEGEVKEPPKDPQTPYETLQTVELRLVDKRNEEKRPPEMGEMSVEDLKREKVELQKALLFYESVHGRPVTREDRDRVRPLYDRYRQVKRGIVRLTSKDSIELAPILEHETMDFTLASPQHHRGGGNTVLQEEPVEGDGGARGSGNNCPPQEETTTAPTTLSISEAAAKAICEKLPLLHEINLGDLHALSIHELKDRKREAKEQKKSIRKILRDYEEKFEAACGRKLVKEERGHMDPSYAQYKHVKAKLRLLDALLSKFDKR